MVQNYQQTMKPILSILHEEGPLPLYRIVQRVADHFNLSQSEREELIASGKTTVVRDRVGWGVVYLHKAGLITRIERGVYGISKEGSRVLREDPPKITPSYLRRYDSFKEFYDGRSTRGSQDADSEIVQPEVEITPTEKLEQSYREIRAQLADELLDRVTELTPFQFEHLVVDLLVKMGYGGSLENCGTVTPMSGDEGIDGTIKEDKLGLDTIYIQAKRWAFDRPVGRPEIQKFVGALSGYSATKGVFITTSTFTQEAQEYIKRINTRIVLIDGQQLAQLMIDNGVGCAVERVYEIKRVDSDYFLVE